MSQYLTLLISFITDFTVTAGSTLAGGALAKGELPTKGVWLLAAVMGLVSAARRVQALLTPTPNH